jgi:hypothetical protein
MVNKQLIILKAIQTQIENPARAIVNCEGAFVRTRLLQQGYTDIAKEYWQWVCRGGNTAWFGEEVMSAQDVLNQIDKGVTMPEWGYAGT